MTWRPDERLVTIPEAAELITRPESTIRRWISEGRLIPFAKQGRRSLYLEADVLRVEARVSLSPKQESPVNAPKKTSVVVRVSAEEAEIYDAVRSAFRREMEELSSPDPAVRKARAERLAGSAEERKRLLIERYAAALARHSVAKEGTDRRLVDVMEIHRPEEGWSSAVCHACLDGGFEPDYVDWPCETWLAASGEEGARGAFQVSAMDATLSP